MEEKKPDKDRFFAETEELIENYIKDRLLLIRLDASEKGAKLAAHFVAGALLCLIALFILLFVSIMAGYYFTEITGSPFWGFAIISGAYILMFILVLALRKRFLYPFVINFVIRILFDRNNEEENGETAATTSESVLPH
jgi:hypothetical protein